MRWHDGLILITIGALVLGAYFFRGALIDMLTPQEIYLASPDTYYIVGNFHAVGSFLAVVVLGLLLHFGLIRWAGRNLAGCGALALCTTLIGAAFIAVMPLVLHSNAMPGRYVDYEPAFERWSMIANVSALITGTALAALLTLAAVTIFRRLRR